MSYDMLDFVPEVDELRGGMWLRGADQLVMKKQFGNIYLTCDHFRDMTQPIVVVKLVFIGK